MIRDLFQSAGGYDLYGVLSTIIFLVFFIMMLFYAISLKKKDMEDCSRMPLDNQENNSEEIKDL